MTKKSGFEVVIKKSRAIKKPEDKPPPKVTYCKPAYAAGYVTDTKVKPTKKSKIHYEKSWMI